MQIALISDGYPPVRSSAAVQMRDLARELAAQGHDPVVLVPTEGLGGPWAEETLDGVRVLRLAARSAKSCGYVRRALSELTMPLAMLRGLRSSPLRDVRWGGVVWYSPTIFFGPLVWFLKRKSGCPTYLILRDIFPEWALDLGLLRRGPTYLFFKIFAHLQYALADSIGVQTASNMPYLSVWAARPDRELEVLHNWLANAPDVGSSISIAGSVLAGRRILVYAGNMGVGQGVDILVDLAHSLRHRGDIGFLFVGRGTEVPHLIERAQRYGLTNTVFHTEVDSQEMPGLLAQCDIGLLALDLKHKTHNIPGKFLTYLMAGLPVLARVNKGTDLMRLIEQEGVGRAYAGDSVDALRALAEEIVDNPDLSERMSRRGRALRENMFSPSTAARQIVAALSSKRARLATGRSFST